MDVVRTPSEHPAFRGDAHSTGTATGAPTVNEFHAIFPAEIEIPLWEALL